MSWKSRPRPCSPLLALCLAGFVLLLPVVAQAQKPTPAPPAPAATQAPAQKPADLPPPPPPYFETVTVSATLAPSAMLDVPGTISVITAAAIDRALMVNVADLVKFEPGVYIESNLGRIGLNGFNIRGIGGNRVMTQVDGVETSEQFDFGPFNVHQFGLDLDVLKSAEIVRSAGSSLYGSDALGGVVSFFTKAPGDYLQGRRFHSATKLLYDGRSQDANGNVVMAGGSARTQASMFVSYGSGREPRNRGRVDSSGATRTALNPQDRQGVQALGKVAFTPAAGHALLGSIEIVDNRVETDALSSRTASVVDITSHDTMRRQRVSVEHTLQQHLGLHQWTWSAYFQNSDTAQIVDEVLAATGTSPRIERSGTLDYSQRTVGGSVQGRKVFTPAGHGILLTFGGSYKRNAFDMLRDRTDINTETGAVVPATSLILPSKYFPASVVSEAGVYTQGEVRIGRLTLRPGLRYDRFSLDADDTDEVYLASLSPAPVDASADAVSSRLGATLAVSDVLTLHGQYAGGFRAPPYSAVNSGFTNLQGGYTSLPNASLLPETSHNVEAGARIVAGRVSLGATVFSNHYADFILQASRGFNPSTRLLEFQYQNVSRVRIRGVELQGDAHLTDRVRLRVSYALIRGNDVSGDVDVPLNSVAPDQGAVGLEYSDRSGRWGTDISARGVTKPSSDRVVPDGFVPPAYLVADVTGWVALSRRVTLRGGVLNVTNARYFEWSNVRGRLATDAAIDRYSSPGISGIVSLAYGW
jgi:hemoglobin/transferrin/lactoferrin receptor protein